MYSTIQSQVIPLSVSKRMDTKEDRDSFTKMIQKRVSSRTGSFVTSPRSSVSIAREFSFYVRSVELFPEYNRVDKGYSVKDHRTKFWVRFCQGLFTPALSPREQLRLPFTVITQKDQSFLIDRFNLRDVISECEDRFFVSIPELIGMVNSKINYMRGLLVFTFEEQEQGKINRLINTYNTEVEFLEHVWDSNSDSLEPSSEVPSFALMSEKLGKGVQGSVKKAYDLVNQNLVAVKKQKTAEDPFFTLYNEYRILKKLNRYAVYIPSINKGGEFSDYLFTELRDGNLRNYLFNSGKATNKEVSYFVSDLINELVDIHSKKIVHRDLKLENFLISNLPRKKLYLADFGLSQDLSEESFYELGGFHGTPKYMAPESLTLLEYSEKSDIWMFGMVVFRLLLNSDSGDWFQTVEPASTESDDNLDSKTVFSEISKHINESIKISVFIGKTDAEIQENLDKLWKQLEIKRCSTLPFIFDSPDSYLRQPRLHKYPGIFMLLRVCLKNNPKDRPTALELKALLEKEIQKSTVSETIFQSEDNSRSDHELSASARISSTHMRSI